MTYEQKLDIVIEAIKEAKKFTRKDYLTKLYIGNGNGLTRVGIDATYDILLQLQDDEKVIKVNKKITSQGEFDQTIDIKNDVKNYFLIEVLGELFEKWCAIYQIKQKGKVENLSEKNFREVYFVLGQIDEQLQLEQSNKLSICFVESAHDLDGYESNDVDELIGSYIKVIEYLKKIDVIKKYTHGTMSLDVDLTIDVSRFFEVLESARIAKLNSEKKEPKQTNPITTNFQANYDSKKGILSLGSKIVRFNKNSFRAKLIELILKDEKNKKYEWSWDEVIQAIEDTKDTGITKDNKKKFYPACDGLTKHVALKTGINDLLIFNKSTVQLNPKYIIRVC